MAALKGDTELEHALTLKQKALQINLNEHIEYFSKAFNFILTYDEDLLNKLDNAVLFEFGTKCRLCPVFNKRGTVIQEDFQ